MPKYAPFEFNGLATEVMHYPGLLEKVGIEVQYFRFGKYKSVSGETMGRKETTAPVREMIQCYLDRNFVDAVALHRKLPKEKVLELVDDSHLKSDWALDSKLIDRLAYWDEVEADVRGRLKLEGDQQGSSSAKYRNVSEGGPPEGKHTFALISQGLIGGKGDSGGFGGDGNQGSTPIINEDKDVKAIRPPPCRSPAARAWAATTCAARSSWRRRRSRSSSPCPTWRPAAATGCRRTPLPSSRSPPPTPQRGHLLGGAVAAGHLRQAGAERGDFFKRGAHADSIMGARKFTDDEAKRFDDDLHASYARFVELAAHGRNKKPEEMEEVAQGRTWLGDKALELGWWTSWRLRRGHRAGEGGGQHPAGDPVTLKQYAARGGLLHRPAPRRGRRGGRAGPGGAAGAEGGRALGRAAAAPSARLHALRPRGGERPGARLPDDGVPGRGALRSRVRSRLLSPRAMSRLAAALLLLAGCKPQLPGSITTFTATPAYVADGDTVTLTWAANQKSCRIEPGLGALLRASGSMDLTPSVTTYVLACGDTTGRALVNVSPRVKVTRFTADRRRHAGLGHRRRGRAAPSTPAASR